MNINTVSGSVPSKKLGMTLIHEHFLFGFPGWQGDATLGPFDRDACMEAGLKMAEAVKEQGVKTIVDATPNECGRDVKLLREISEKSGLTVLCSSGYYFEGEGAPPYFKLRSQLGDGTEQVYEMFKTEVTKGVGDTGIKPAVFKVASSKEAITDYETMFFKAAARVSKEDGIPIITHTQEGKLGPEQADLLIAEGADPKRIMIGHIGGSTDIDYLLRVLEKGVSIGFDRFGVEGVGGTPPDSRRIACLIGLLGLGYADKIMISHDFVNYWLGRQGVSDIIGLVMPNYHITHIFKDIIPALKKAAVSDDQINTMLIDNPRRLLAGD
ncbi:MAG: phosphotriesterase-related protein [Deltaproteobacteria bacterium]|nr:phosphotriesterase-related protein [Deltaproteobacteria bacterium]